MTVVVVGGGLAGAKTVEHLRDRAYDGRVVLIGSEPERPYERPPLSKGYLQGSQPREEAFVHAPDWYAAHDVDLRTGTSVASIDLAARDVLDAAGTRTGFDHLVLATGSEPRRIDVPGSDLAGVHVLRTLDDSDRLKAALSARPHVAVVGGGWIGLEVAAAARAAGCEVSVLVRDPLPLVAPLGRELAQVFADLHRSNGVDLRVRTEVASLVADGSGTAVGAVELADGTRVDAELVVVGIGAAPRTDLAKAVGLRVEDGVVVDQHLRSSHPHVLAVGDIARAAHPFLGTHVRVEHWANALNQPATAAATIVGADEPYDALPYFFTDQFDLGMEYIGHVGSHGYDEVVVRGDLEAREFVAFWRREGRVLAGMNVNVWDVVDDVQALIRSRAVVDRDRLADPDVPLAELR
ncbi:NAD(P)/FAD-dependent oxidoreductase [Cellulomonas alba]|uniref:FAD-dependent oxidoreductase n=1 Tax=Cellulomonas alba TaxID=3053467 RepID=A0ABT7SBD6_9CELL|nr:FAD-dependent oxidoreductase [Cellulomonas alba]MDM7853492.1 FAD-dependent oxidoreductase [Cellulomonas alba]